MHGLTVFMHVLHHQRHLLDMLLEQGVELLNLLGVQIQFALQKLGHGPVVTCWAVALSVRQRRTAPVEQRSRTTLRIGTEPSLCTDR